MPKKTVFWSGWRTECNAQREKECAFDVFVLWFASAPHVECAICILNQLLGCAFFLTFSGLRFPYFGFIFRVLGVKLGGPLSG